MAKPDMSRNKDLAGKTVSKGGYNISYNENGYATSAIKTGSKTGKAAAPSADTVGGGGSDRGSYGGSVYDQEHFSNDELRSAAEVRAAAAAGKTTWADAHDYVERIRSNYGYSGDTDGSRYIPLEMGGGGRGNGGGGFSYEAAPTYTSRYQNQIDDLTRQILNREAFSYDPEKDPTYQQYKESYTRSGERAMQDTLGQVSARTGGLASSYAGSAAQQTYDNYMGALADKIPELKQLAYSMYQDEGNTQRANLEMLVALEQGDYAKYADLLAQYNTDRSFDYGVHRDNKTTTRRLFVTTQIAALGWVTMSYLIALYATVRLGQVFPVVDLSKQAIETILGVNVLKVVENIFEHNDGAVFGKSNAPEKKVKRDC